MYFLVHNFFFSTVFPNSCISILRVKLIVRIDNLTGFGDDKLYKILNSNSSSHNCLHHLVIYGILLIHI